MARSTTSKDKLDYELADGDVDKAIKIATDAIEKKFGKGSIMKMGEHAAQMDIAVIPTGSLALDAALGIGGVPKGRIIEIYGPESSGKTTLASPSSQRARPWAARSPSSTQSMPSTLSGRRA